MLEAFLRDLSQPEYLHVLINPLPIYGLAVGIPALLLALVQRRRAAQVIALWVVFIAAISAWPAAHYGETAYDRVLSMADDPGRAWLEAHESRADNLVWCFYALAAVSLCALALPKRWPQLGAGLAIATLLFAFVSIGAGSYIAYAGGKIRHREFRTVPPPPHHES